MRKRLRKLDTYTDMNVEELLLSPLFGPPPLTVLAPNSSLPNTVRRGPENDSKNDSGVLCKSVEMRFTVEKWSAIPLLEARPRSPKDTPPSREKTPWPHVEPMSSGSTEMITGEEEENQVHDHSSRLLRRIRPSVICDSSDGSDNHDDNDNEWDSNGRRDDLHTSPRRRWSKINIQTLSAESSTRNVTFPVYIDRRSRFCL
jgi:hypothetical protein